MRSTPLLFLICLTINAHAQDDYRIYHRWINNAERCFFLEHKTDSAYSYYDLAFSKFDFVFAKDCYMAAQIAYYNKNEKYVAYLKKGFQNGLRSEQLKYSDVLAPLLKDTIAYKKKFSDYQALRKVYLKRINVWALKKTIQHVSQDQSEKNIRYSDNDYEDLHEYDKRLEKHISFIESMIKTVGFPGDKLIGIDQADIMKELGHDSSDYMDMYNLIYKDPKYHTEAMQFCTCGNCIAQASVFPLLVHQVCLYQHLSAYWEKLIVSGQIHPRDVAELFDISLQLYDYPAVDRKRGAKIADAFACDYVRPYGGYKISFYLHWQNFKYSNYIIDSMRTALYINTLEVDSAKNTFGSNHGFKTNFGFWDCR